MARGRKRGGRKTSIKSTFTPVFGLKGRGKGRKRAR